MATPRRHSGNTGTLLRRTVPRGAVAGIGAYVGGYLVTSLLAAIDGVEVAGEIGTWRAVGWVFYGAHNVDIRATGTGGGRSGSATVTIFGRASEVTNLTDTVPVVLYLLVPVVAVAAAGGLLVRSVDTRSHDTARTAAVGTLVTAGYLPLAVLGRFLFEYAATGRFLGQDVSVTVAPELATSVLLVGLVYPIVFGAIGAIVAQ